MPKFAHIVIDAIAVAVFAAIGRASHHEALTAVGVLTTAWPFWTGAAAGWAICLLGRGRTLLGEGITVWLSAVVLGHVIRLIVGPGTQVAFVIVSVVALGVLLLGWRGIVALAARRAA